MEFSELKMIWDSQNEEPLYAVNEAALQRSVQRRTEESQRCLSRCYAVEILVGVISGAFMLVCAGMLAFVDSTWFVSPSWMKAAVSHWHVLALLLAAAIWFYYSAYMYLARKRQQERVGHFDSSLRGDLDRGLAQTEFQIALARDIVWRGLAPLWLAAALWVATLFHLLGASLGIWVIIGLAMIGSLVAVVLGKQQSIRNRFEPRRRELEALRAKLTDPHP